MIRELCKWIINLIKKIFQKLHSFKKFQKNLLETKDFNLEQIW